MPSIVDQFVGECLDRLVNGCLYVSTDDGKVLALGRK
jgi:hypothetical protein